VVGREQVRLPGVASFPSVRPPFRVEVTLSSPPGTASFR
jgi:hypothetical protein